MTIQATDDRSPAEGSHQGPSADDAHEPRMPGQPDMWAFAFFELLVFGAYFAVYLHGRVENNTAFLASQAHLDAPFGVANTLLMLSSSWSMARCILATRRREFRTATRYAWVSVALGAAFLVSKVVGWILLTQEGYGFDSSEFFTYYYFFTGIHLVHLIAGLVALGVVLHQLHSPERRSLEAIETAGVYWHTVDLLWVLIFSLLYVVR
jgi:nitric oxide reductase NorE protein